MNPSENLAERPVTVLVEQNDWSEERNINPYAVFDKPPAMLQITPNLGRRGQTGIAVTGINFTPSKSGIVLRCDGQVMASNLISDEAGRVSASFTIPESARNGNRIVEMADGVYSARASLQIFVPRDPLAQTFSFIQNQVISSIGLQFTARDPSIPVTVQIRGVTTGLPNGVVFAEKVLAPNEISLSGETRIRFDDPFYAEANTSYAVVLLTNSTNYKVRTATLGKMGRWGIITRQTYMEGVLLESSNAETWTPLNGSDLAMKIYGYNFQSDGLIRDHALGLLENLHQRLARLELTSKLPADEAEAFTALLARMRADESRNLELHASLITSDTASG